MVFVTFEAMGRIALGYEKGCKGQFCNGGEGDKREESLMDNGGHFKSESEEQIGLSSDARMRVASMRPMHGRCRLEINHMTVGR